jgi:tetratricopeptide (TPR) repeat protein
MGVSERGLKKFKKATEAYQKAAKLAPKDPRPWYNLAVLSQMHLATADGVNQEGTKKQFNTAKKHYRKFLELAGSKKEFSVNVLEAKDSLAMIDQSFEFFKIQKELEAQAAAMEKLQKEQDAEERKRLLELEKKAQAAAAAGG